MRVKIKSLPEDFVVEEEATLPLKKKGAFSVYLLKKNNRNTLELLLELSKKTGIPLPHFSYGGRKDRHALTSQFISIRSRKIAFVSDENHSLEFLGFMDRPMGPDLIKGNNFQISLRALTPLAIDAALKELEYVNVAGFPNYFDDQRFGSFDPRQGFLAEKLLKEEFNGALKIYLTSITSTDKAPDRQRKEYFFKHWKDKRACRQASVTDYEKKIFDSLILDSNAVVFLLRQIPKYRMSNYFSAYQSYIWNEVVRRVIAKKISIGLKKYPGAAGDYVFFGNIGSFEREYLDSLVIPTIPVRNSLEDVSVDCIIREVFLSRQIKNSMFNKLKIRQVFFKSVPRSVIVKPDKLTFYVAQDELSRDKKKLVLNFFLARGSFATMLIKRLFCL